MSVITVKDLTYVYPDNTKALDSLSFTVNSDDKIAIIGHNGSGKSTLLLILSALMLPTTGKVNILEKELSHKTKSIIRKDVGILFAQVEYQFIMPDLLNDIMLSITDGNADQRKEQALQWLNQVDLVDMAFHSPLALSSGQMKRAALAGVLAKNPNILLLDEPLANLDKPSSDAVLHILSSLSIPIIFATHSLYAIQQLANRVIVLEKGKIVCDSKINNKTIKKYINNILL